MPTLHVNKKLLDGDKRKKKEFQNIDFRIIYAAIGLPD
jgi:hypothetical protein